MRNTYDQNETLNTSMIAFTARIILALVLLGTGGLFFLNQYDSRLMAGEWWVIYLFILGIGLLAGAIYGYVRAAEWTPMILGFGIFSVLLFVLGLIFAADPHWSFTQNWNFTLFSNIEWDKVWPFILIIPGVVLLIASFLPHREKP